MVDRSASTVLNMCCPSGIMEDLVKASSRSPIALQPGTTATAGTAMPVVHWPTNTHQGSRAYAHILNMTVGRQSCQGKIYVHEPKHAQFMEPCRALLGATCSDSLESLVSDVSYAA